MIPCPSLAKSPPMKKLPITAPKIPVEDTFGWIAANLDRLALGALVAAGIVAIMLVMRAIGHRMLQPDPEVAGWRGVIGRVLSKTKIFFMIAAALDIVASYADVPVRIERATDIFLLVAAAFQIAIWSREILIGVIRTRVGEDPGASTLGNAMSLIRVLVSVAVFAIAAVVILDNLGVNVTALVAGLGIGGIAIGLAAQGIFADLFAALAIVFDRPFRRGDTIRYGTTTGTVERIGLKTTRLRATTGQQVIMGNTKLLEQEVQNLADARVRRVFLPFGLAYRTSPDDLAALPDIVEPALADIKGVKLVRCVATAFATSSIDCELVYDDRTNNQDVLAQHKSMVIIGVASALAERGIQFATPTQTAFTAAPDGTLIMPYEAGCDPSVSAGASGSATGEGSSSA